MKSAKHIADRIRLLIATKQFQVEEFLPSTRELGKQLEVSFHTVRKAYLALVNEGMLESYPGKGYLVSRQNTSIDKSDRLEKGAVLMRQLLEELISYGLSTEEVELLFDEQLNYVEWPERLQSCATVGVTKEHAKMISSSIKTEIGVKSATITIDDPEEVVSKFDALFVPVSYLRLYKGKYESVLIIPIVYQFTPSVLVEIANQAIMDSVGLVCLDDGSISQITDELKTALKYSGSIIAGSVYGRSLPLFVREVDIVLYLPGSAALVEKQLPERKRIPLHYQISEFSLNLIRSELWDQ